MLLIWRRAVDGLRKMTGYYTLTLSCEDRPGLVAAVAGALANTGGNIVDAQQFDDIETGRFFMRTVFTAADDAPFRKAMKDIGAQHGMNWRLRDNSVRKRVLLLVSKFDHCLVDLLYRYRIGELPMMPVGIVSNHPLASLNIGETGDIPFFYFPIEKGGKSEQEAKIQALIESTGAELIVLARYMQILSDGFATRLAGKCINIHHSFLPGFKGARPYHQAHARGVKMIGATAHFVTPDLDEGPIIAQDVEPISHADAPDELIRKGRDIERRVLADAVRCFLEDRVLLNDTKTVVFRG